MNEEQRIKKEIMDRLNARPKFKIYCLLCGEHCVTTSEQREMIHYECYISWKKSRQKPSESTHT